MCDVFTVWFRIRHQTIYQYIHKVQYPVSFPQCACKLSSYPRHKPKFKAGYSWALILYMILYYIIYFDNQNSLSFRGWKLSSQDTFYTIGCVMGSLFECLLILLIDLPLWSSTFLNMIKLLKHDFSEKKHWCKHVIISFMLAGNVTFFSPGEKKLNWTGLIKSSAS